MSMTELRQSGDVQPKQVDAVDRAAFQADEFERQIVRADGQFVRCRHVGPAEFNSQPVSGQTHAGCGKRPSASIDPPAGRCGEW